MNSILSPLMYLATLGLILSAIVHVSYLLGIQPPFGAFSWILPVGMFAVFLPAILVSNKLSENFKRKDFWKASLRGCPNWMKNLIWFFFGYAMLNFAVFVLFTNGHSPAQAGDLRMPSGYWMAFYSVAMAIMYSAIHVKDCDKIRRCQNGHVASPSATFCKKCGSKIIEPENTRS